MKKTFLLLCLLCFIQHILAQQSAFTIRYVFTSNRQLTSDSIIPELMRPFQTQGLGENTQFPVLSEMYSKTGNICKNSVVYQVTDTSCAYIADGYGHEIIILPNDTLNVALSIVPESDSGKLNGKFHNPWLLNYVYSGKNLFIYSLLDSLAYNTGALNIEFTSLTSVNNDINKFYEIVSAHYDQRVKYLNDYCLRYHIPEKIKELVYAEIKSAHLIDLMRAYDRSDTYPEKYLLELKDLKFDNETLFFKTSLYHNVAASYLKFFKSDFNEEQPFAVSFFLKNYNAIKNSYTGRVRDYLVAEHLNNFINAKITSFDSVLTDFKSISTDLKYYGFIDSVYKKRLYTYGTTLRKAMKSYVVKPDGNKIRIESLFKGRPVLVDCWASWCGPCIYQIPFAAELEKEYAGKIDFVYLSLDKQNAAWIAKLNSLKLGGSQFQMENNFKSLFANYFEIRSIPRYILFDKSGKVITPNAPRPSRKSQLVKLLNSAALGSEVK
ncbi:MAG: TlpA family protein disulfide reductase [Bacteroidetes bacterium]|nr:TlpA family protein disulfide reductase [Bacteroidota bacterium]